MMKDTINSSSKPSRQRPLFPSHFDTPYSPDTRAFYCGGVIHGVRAEEVPVSRYRRRVAARKVVRQNTDAAWTISSVGG